MVSAVFIPDDPTAFIASTGTVSVTVTQAFSIGITLTVTNAPAGTFSFSVASTNTITLAVSGDTATGVMIPVTVSDTRNTYPGWAVVGQAAGFTNPASHPAGDIPGDQLGWVPSATSLADSALLGAAVAPAAPGLGTTAAVLGYAFPGRGFGTSTLGANLTLAIPSNAPSGAYAGVLTLTAEPAGP